MPSPDKFMPFYGNEFYQACEGRSHACSDGYSRALWYYWHHRHCNGIENDERLLRRLVRAENDDEWEEVRSFVFDNKDQFCLGGDGLWHQKRAYELWQEIVAQYDRRVAASKIAVMAKRRTKRRP